MVRELQRELLARGQEALLHAEVIREANLALTQDLSLERVLETLLDYLRKLVPYDSASVMLAKGGSRFVVTAFRGYESFVQDVKLMKEYSFDATKNALFRQMRSNRESLLIPDTEKEPSWERVPGGEHARNWIGVPLVAHGEMIGLYSLDKAQPDYFTPQHVRKAELLAVQAATAIQNARLFQQGARYARELEQRISERERAEEALRESREYLRQIIDCIADPIFVKDQNHRFVLVNKALCDLGGFSRDDFIGKTDSECFPKEQVDIFLEQDKLVLKTGAESTNEEEITDAEGHVRTIVTKKTLLSDRGNKYIVGVIRDITELKKAQEELSGLASIVQSTDDAVVSADLDRIVRSWNPGAERLYGYSAEEAIGQPVTKYIPSHRQHEALAIREAVIRGKRLEHFETERLRKDGTTVMVSLTLSPILDATGTLIGISSISRDITERKKAEALRDGQSRVLDLIATNAPLAEILNTLTRVIEAQSDGMLCSVLLLDEDGQHIRHIAAPSLPADYIKGIDGATIGPQVGSCGTAMYRRERVIVTDILHDPLWVDYRDLAVRHGLRACWSTPIFSSEGKLLGSFAMYYHEPGSPSAAETRLINLATHIAGIAVERRNAEESLRRSEKRFATAFQSNPIPSAITTLQSGCFLAVNDSFLRATGYTREEVVGHAGTELKLWPTLEEREKAIQSLKKEGSLRDVEGTFQRKDGEPRAMLFSLEMIELDGQECLLLAASDITERKRAEEALAESEERYRELFENARDAIYVHDLSGRYTSINRAAEKLSGYSREEILGKRFVDFVTPEDLPLVQSNFWKKLADHGQTDYELEVIAKDGRRVPVELSSCLIFENGVAVGILGTARDITERKRAEEELRNYSRRLIEAQEAERQRIARELHDEIGQALTAVRINHNTLEHLCQQSPALPYVKENIGIIEEVLRQTQDLSLELRPSLLDDFGLAAAIRWYINRYGLRTGIVTQAVIDSLIFDARLSRELEINCFRIAQEALTNVARHAEARHARLELQRLNGELVLLVKDDGTGMDLRALRKQNSRATLGLRGMEERALAVGGRIEIHSVPSEGTEIRATFPIRSNKDE